MFNMSVWWVVMSVSMRRQDWEDHLSQSPVMRNISHCLSITTILHLILCGSSHNNSSLQVDLNTQFDIWAGGEESGEYPIWSDDSQCSHYVTQFTRLSSLPPLALASFPGSGNTWLRYLIEGATGVFSGSIYRGKYLECFFYIFDE